MGAWGSGSFENDASLDFLNEIGDDVEASLRAALEEAVQAEYLDVDAGGFAWAAAEIVATALGRPGAELPEEVKDVASELSPDQARALRELALSALKCLTGDSSELMELYEAPDGMKGLEDLRDRLVACAHTTSAGTAQTANVTGTSKRRSRRKLLELPLGRVLRIALDEGQHAWAVVVSEASTVAVLDGCFGEDASLVGQAAPRAWAFVTVGLEYEYPDFIEFTDVQLSGPVDPAGRQYRWRENIGHRGQVIIVDLVAGGGRFARAEEAYGLDVETILTSDELRNRLATYVRTGKDPARERWDWRLERIAEEGAIEFYVAAPRPMGVEAAYIWADLFMKKGSPQIARTLKRIEPIDVDALTLENSAEAIAACLAVSAFGRKKSDCFNFSYGFAMEIGIRKMAKDDAIQLAPQAKNVFDRVRSRDLIRAICVERFEERGGEQWEDHLDAIAGGIDKLLAKKKTKKKG